MAPDLGRDHSEQMQRVGMIGLQRQRFAIVRFGLRQPAFLMVREAGGKRPATRGSDAKAPDRLAADSAARCLRFTS